MSITSFSLKRPVLVCMIIGVLLISGIIAFGGLSTTLLPVTGIPCVCVRALYTGAGPGEIEASVVEPMEDALSTVGGIKNITARCSEGAASLVIGFNPGIDPEHASVEIKNKLDAIAQNLPSGMCKPVIGTFDMDAAPMLTLALTGPQTPEELRRIAEKLLRARILKVPGVASVGITGGQEREIQVNLQKAKLDGIGQTVTDVAATVSAQTATIPGGHVVGDRIENTICVSGAFTSIDQIAALKIPVAGSGGDWVPLSTLGSVIDSYKEVREKARYDGEPAVGLAIWKVSSAGNAELAGRLFGEIDKLKQILPGGVSIGIVQDRSQVARESMKALYHDILIGIVLAGIVIYFLLGDWRLVSAVAIVIPASVIVIFLSLRIFGHSINLITLMAIGIGAGMLFTDAIIILESIVRRRNSGQAISEASVAGARESVGAVVTSAGARCIVFLPMALMGGGAGQNFKAFGITIATAVLASVVLSLTLTPLVASRLLRTRGTRKKNFGQNGLTAFRDRYLKLLKGALAHPLAVALGAAVICFCTMVVLTNTIDKETMPSTDEGLLTIDLTMPSGASLSSTDRAVAKIETRVSGIHEVASVYSSIGGSTDKPAVNAGRVIVKLVDKKRRDRSAGEVAQQIRAMIADIPDAGLAVNQARSVDGAAGDSSDIRVEITGDRMSELLAVADSVSAKAATVGGVADIRLRRDDAQREVKFIPDRDRMDEYGVNTVTLGNTLHDAVSGKDAAVYKEANQEYPIRLRLAESDRNSIDKVGNIAIPAARGFVPLKAVATVREGGEASIDRKNGRRLVAVTMNVARGKVGSKAEEIQKLTNTIVLGPGDGIRFVGPQIVTAKSIGGLLGLIVLSIILVYTVLAIVLESFSKPLLIMVTLPMGLTGALWALFVTGNSLSMVSAMSIVLLFGLVVGNAFVILDFAHKKIREGFSGYEAIVDACRVKFSAIIVTTLAMIITSLPLALTGNTVYGSFAITVIGGVIVSTTMTLFVIPAIFVATMKIARPRTTTDRISSQKLPSACRT